MDKKALLEGAALKQGSTTVLGQTVNYREPAIGVRMEYATLVKDGKIVEARALLIQKCCFDDEWKELFTAEEATLIAGGSVRVAAPLLNSILEREEEVSVKNDSPQNESSSSNLPGT